MKRRITSILLSMSLCLGLSVSAFAAASSATFTDVPTNHWAYQYINESYEDGVITGTSYDEATGNRAFSPDSPLTMSQFITILTRAFYREDVTASTATGSWYAPFEAVAKVHNLTDGLGTVNMDAKTTRYQMAVIMTNIMRDKVPAEQMPSKADIQATSAKISDWKEIPAEYQDAVATVFALGIITGVNSAGTFLGEANTNRAQAAVIYVRLNNAIETLNNGGDIKPEPEPEPEPTPGEPTLANGEAITEENVLALIEKLKDEYPDGGTYDPYEAYYSRAFGYRGFECAKLAFMLSDEVWGNLPVRKHTDVSKVRPGDVIVDNAESHWQFVTSYATVDPYAPEGYNMNSVGGGSAGVITWNKLGTVYYPGEYVIYTRYPN